MKTGMRFTMRGGFFLGAVAALLVLNNGCVRERSPVTGEKQFYGYSWSQEQQMGAQSDEQIVQQFGVYDDPALQDYVKSVGQSVLQGSDLRDPNTPEKYRNTQFTFRVLDSTVVNAFALPGGYVYVTRGLLTHVNNEAQLAVVLGHEIGHVAARHASERAVKAQLGQAGLMAGAIIGQQVLDKPNVAENILKFGGSAFQLLLMKYSRDDEREADRLGVEYAAQDHYQVSEAAQFFHTLDRVAHKEGAVLPAWQSTHPDPGERAQTILELASQWQARTTLNRVEPDVYLEHLNGIVVGEDPRQGFAQNGVFYHPELRFQLPIPSGWKVNNERAAVIMIDPQQQALMALELTGEPSPQAAAEKLKQQQGVQITSSAATRVNGLNAYMVMGQIESQQGQFTILDYLIEYGGKVYSILGYTTAGNFPSHREEFDHTMQGFAPVNEPGILNAQPAHLKIVTASRAAPFHEFVSQPLPPDIMPEDLAIMNQVELDTMISQGRKLKLAERTGPVIGTR